MDTTNIVSSVGILATFVVGIINLMVTKRIASKSDYNDVISRTRNDWIRDLRLETGEFISIAINIFYSSETDRKQFGELVKHGFVIRTHLGNRFDEYSQCVNDIITMLDNRANATELLFKEKILELEKQSSACYIDQWKRNKEATGKNTKKKS